MIAGANEISAAAVGLVYLCAVFPAILCKATGPYWFHLVAYRWRMATVALLMACAYTTVAFSTRTTWQLLGVVFASLQGGLGEASCLALTSYYSGRPAITAWSSGTGFAGVFGYSWVALLHVLGGLSFKVTLLAANATTVAFLAVYGSLLGPSQPWHPSRNSTIANPSVGGGGRQQQQAPHVLPPPIGSGALVGTGSATTAVGGHRSVKDEILLEGETRHLLAGSHSGSQASHAVVGRAAAQAQHAVQHAESESEGLIRGPWSSDDDDDAKASKACRMTWRERAARTAALWQYMTCLMLVYFAEYAMQSGTWSAIGFPVHEAKARHTFYTYSNWMYQAGVFVSRSSGMIYQASRAQLWAMPALQVGWLAFFLVDAVHKFWYNYWLLVPCFATGLLGGACYVNAFNLISKEVEPQYREFSLGAASLGDSLGVALADITGILIQGCLFKANRLQGAAFKC
ncbi:hypothetical protein N2152v2_005623 [Parachlorella kessleri]